MAVNADPIGWFRHEGFFLNETENTAKIRWVATPWIVLDAAEKGPCQMWLATTCKAHAKKVMPRRFRMTAKCGVGLPFGCPCRAKVIRISDKSRPIVTSEGGREKARVAGP